MFQFIEITMHKASKKMIVRPKKIQSFNTTDNTPVKGVLNMRLPGWMAG